MTEKTALNLLAERVRHLETLEEIMSNIHGWDGSAWRKLPLLWGYSDRWADSASGAAVGAGDASATVTDVDAGYVYVLCGVSAYHNAAVNKEFYIQVTNGTQYLAVFHSLAGVPLTNYTVVCDIPLKENDYVRATALAAGDTKSVYLTVWGYKMLIAE